MNSGSETQGVVMCNQPRTIDFIARQAAFIERLPDGITLDVLARVQTLLD
jgi:mRNA interferase ChpB